MKLVVQYLTQAAIELPSAGDDARSRVQHMLSYPRPCMGLYMCPRPVHSLCTPAYRPTYTQIRAVNTAVYTGRVADKRPVYTGRARDSSKQTTRFATYW